MDKDTNNEEYRIKVENGHKCYGNQVILNGINLTVYQSNIYGLLGASGSGKTTLLNCILGLSKLDDGTILFNGILSRKDIGYMPQEISLFQEFTIQEICLFYGKLYGLKQKYTKERIVKLAEIFNLNNINQLISSLSGGEQRRVSLAVTVLHDPTVLLLDEPTVGMDCLLGERMWKYFIKLRDQGTCIILSTHYFQEAMLCNQVGFMRNGIILAEDCPNNLLSRYNATNLEHVLLQLSINQEKLIVNNDTSNLKKKKCKIIKSSKDLFPSEQLFNINRFHAQLTKNINWHTKHYLITIALLLYPLWIAIIYSLSTGSLNTKNYSIGLLNEEFANNMLGYQYYCDHQNQSYTLEDFNLTCSISNRLSCLFIDIVNLRFNLEYYHEWNLAQLSLQKNKVSAIIRIPNNFTNGMMGRVENGFFADDNMISTSYMDVALDSSSLYNYLFLK